MSKPNTDFNIENYNIEELLTIFGINSPVRKEVIMKVAAGFIEKYKEIGESKYVEFFSKGMNKLLSNYQLIEGILGKVDDLLDDIEETREEIKERIQETSEDLTNKFETVKIQAKDFINPPVEDAATNILKNRYYNAKRMQTRLGPGVVMPNRADYTNIPEDGVGAHAPQLQNRLFLPNAFAQIPFAQGYRNPTLQNAFLTWINIDSQYREILPTGTSSASCPIDPSNNFLQTDSPSDFTFALANPITNVLAMTVGSIEVPMAGYYAFSDKYGNTTFEIVLGDNAVACLRIPEGNYDASGIMQFMNDELEKAWAKIYHSLPAPCWPQIFINKSNQKVYFAFFPGFDPTTQDFLYKAGGLKFRWFDREKCGCCDDCCTVNSNIDEQIISKLPKTTVFEVNPNKSYKCADKNTGKKINSTLGWSLGFREQETEFKFINTRINMVADASLNEIASDGIYFGMFGNCIWNELGTKYLILEVDDFNRNRNSGNMGTMSMPTCTENFKIPNYAKNISQIYPICDPSDNIQRFPDPGNTDPVDNRPAGTLEHVSFNSETLDEVFDIGPVSPESLVFNTEGIVGYKEEKKSYYEKFNRACRKGTPANPIAIKGEDTLTKAQKYTAREIKGTQQNSCVNQYYPPQSSNILFRFPIQRISDNPQVPIVTPGPGMDSARRYFGPVTIEKLRIRLLDDKGYTIDLGCGEISFSLVVERLYQY